MPLRSNALRHPPLPRLHALLEGSVRDRSEILRHDHFNGFYVRKTCSFHDSIELSEKEEITGSWVWWVWRLFQHSNDVFGKNFPDAQCIVRRRIVGIFAQTFLIPRYFVMIVHTLSQFMSNTFVIILTVKQWSPCSFWRTSLTFSSVLLVTGL